MKKTKKEKERENFLASRRRGIGSSDAAAILGLSPFKTSLAVQREKLYGEESQQENDLLRIGLAMEPVIMTLYHQRTGIKPRRGGMKSRHPDQGIYNPGEEFIQHVSIDAAVPGHKLEMKFMSFPKSSEWGEEGTDEIPDAYIIQCQHSMAVTGDEFIEVPVLMWGRLRIYNVKRNQRLIDWITLKEQEWWSRHIVREQPVLPDVEHPTTLSLVKQIYNIRSQTSIELSDVYIEILDEYQKQCDIHNAAKRASDRELVKILAAMNEFETGFLSDGRIIQRKEIAVPAQMRDAYTYKRIYVRELQNRKGILVKEIGNEKRTEEGNAGAGEGDSKSADHNGSVRPDAPKL